MPLPEASDGTAASELPPPEGAAEPEAPQKAPINLPELEADKFNPVTLTNMLKDGAALWGWYSIPTKYNVSALCNLTYGFDGLAVFRKEGDFFY